MHVENKTYWGMPGKLELCVSTFERYQSDSFTMQNDKNHQTVLYWPIVVTTFSCLFKILGMSRKEFNAVSNKNALLVAYSSGYVPVKLCKFLDIKPFIFSNIHLW
jgi:hypothetical protein